MIEYLDETMNPLLSKMINKNTKGNINLLFIDNLQPNKSKIKRRKGKKSMNMKRKKWDFRMLFENQMIRTKPNATKYIRVFQTLSEVKENK